MPVSFSKSPFVKTIKQLFKMTETLKISVPPYPHTDKAEPACLFCANFLWQRERPTGIYREHAYLTPLEQLIDTVRTLRLHKRKEGDAILPGDLVVIFRGRKVAENIMHTVIALDGDNLNRSTDCKTGISSPPCAYTSTRPPTPSAPTHSMYGANSRGKAPFPFSSLLLEPV